MLLPFVFLDFFFVGMSRGDGAEHDVNTYGSLCSTTGHPFMPEAHGELHSAFLFIETVCLLGWPF